jgi:hypothetical protein
VMRSKTAGMSVPLHDVWVSSRAVRVSEAAQSHASSDAPHLTSCCFRLSVVSPQGAKTARQTENNGCSYCMGRAVAHLTTDRPRRRACRRSRTPERRIIRTMTSSFGRATLSFRYRRNFAGTELAWTLSTSSQRALGTHNCTACHPGRASHLHYD